jgi:hypothetical protein
MTQRTFASVTEVLCTCGLLEERAADASSPFKFDADLKEFHLEYVGVKGKASMVIYHCPFCGGAAPESQRDRLFAVISSAEEERLFSLLKGVHTIHDAIEALGSPDLDRPDGVGWRHPEGERTPPNSERFRRVTYSRLSDVADIHLTVYPNGNVHASLQGKYVGQARA